MMVSDERYLGHKVFYELDEYIDFYKNLSGSVMMFATMGTTSLISIDTYVYSSIQGTVDSIKTLLRIGRINDCYSLVRKYFDSVVINIYSNLYLNENRSADNYIVEKINNWLHGKEKLPPYRIMSEYIRSSESLKEINDIIYSDDLYKKIRERCNDHTHYNYFYNVLLNDNEVHLKERVRLLEALSKDMRSIFLYHVSYICMVCQHYLSSSDLMDYLECGLTPPEDSQYWVAPFFQDVFTSIIMENRPELGAVILKGTAMHLEEAKF